MSIQDNNAVKMRIAIEGVELTYQPIFSLVAELNLQGYSADATSMFVLAIFSFSILLNDSSVICSIFTDSNC